MYYTEMRTAANEILTIIESYGYEAYIVGGAVRDIALGFSPKDIDIATNMPMETIMETFNQTYDIGKSKEFGILVVRMSGFNFEVSQFREERDYTDGRRPDAVTLTNDITADLSRRDFTINAMAIDVNENIIDPFGGYSDIHDRLVRAVGNAEERFSEDYLRMLRAIRFASRLDFNLDIESECAIINNRENIRNIATERIYDELMRMANNTGERFANAILMLVRTGLLEIILPEVDNLRYFTESYEFHPEAHLNGYGTVFDHTIEALKVNTEANSILNMSIVLHDVGKAETHHVDENGRDRYFGHADVEDMITEIANRLRMSNNDADAIRFAVTNHMKFHSIVNMRASKVINLISNENFGILRGVCYCDDACRGEEFDSDRFNRILDRIEEITERHSSENLSFERVVDGNTVMEVTGLEPGPEVGRIINRVTSYVIDEGCEDSIEDLVLRAYNEA